MLDSIKIKEQFPIFKNIPNLVYLDNAATTQKPQRVLDAMNEFYTKYNANVHRGLYPISEKATEKYEEARGIIAKFINAEPHEIIFTSGTTDSINSLATSLQRSEMIPTNPNIILSDLEHHSNILPWQSITKEKIPYLKLDDNYQLEVSDELKTDNSKVVDILSLTAVSNVTGTITAYKKIIDEIKPNYSVLDMAQMGGHFKIDVKKINVDFIAFSAHKLYGPTGIGILYGKKRLLEKMEPFRTGGGMIKEVTREYASWADLPEKFEAGTPQIAEAIGFAEAIRFIEEVGMNQIVKHEQYLRSYLLDKLKEIKNLQIFHPTNRTLAAGVVSIGIKGVHPHDLSQYLGESNICLRAGHHCTQILHRDVLKIPASLRISLGIYNSREDIDLLITRLREGIRQYSK